MTPAGRINLMGFDLDAVTLDGAIEHVAGAIARAEGGWTLTPNLDILRQIVTDPEVRALADQTTLRLADGMPLVWASRLRRTPLPQRVAGSDLAAPLCVRAAREGWRVFFLGGSEGAADAAASILRERAPGLNVCGTLCPPMGFEHDAAYVEHLERTLIAAQPAVVLVALGSPKQERLIARLRPLLPRAWFFGIGITFSFISGEIGRAPPWVRAIGLEWAHRLVQEPRRLARRYLVHGLPFAARLLGESLWQGLTARRPGRAVSRPATGGGGPPTEVRTTPS